MHGAKALGAGGPVIGVGRKSFQARAAAVGGRGVGECGRGRLGQLERPLHAEGGQRVSLRGQHAPAPALGACTRAAPRLSASRYRRSAGSDAF